MFKNNMKSWFQKVKFKEKWNLERQKEQKTNMLHVLWHVKQKKKKVLIFILLLFKRKHKLYLFVQLWNIWAMIPLWSHFRGNIALHLSTQRLKAPLGPSLLWICFSYYCREKLYYLQQAINYHWAVSSETISRPSATETELQMREKLNGCGV